MRRMSMAIVGTIRSKRTRNFTIHFENRLVEITLPSVAPISEIFSMAEMKLSTKIDPTRHSLYFLDTKSSGTSRQSCGDNLAVQISHIPSDIRDLYLEKLGPRHRVFGSRVSEISGWMDASVFFLPELFSRIAKFFEDERNRKAVGLFRIHADRRMVEKYCKMIEVGDVFEFPRDENPHIVAGVLLKFLTELSPPGLIPSKRAFLNLARPDQNEISLDSKFLQEQVPEKELRILGFIVGLCGKVANLSSINKMTPKNLAAVFGPIIFKDMDEQISMEIFTKMIENFDFVFPMSIRDHLARILPRTPRSPRSPKTRGMVERRTEILPKQDEPQSPSNSIGSSTRRSALDSTAGISSNAASTSTSSTSSASSSTSSEELVPIPMQASLVTSTPMSTPPSARTLVSTPISALNSSRMAVSPLQQLLAEKDNEIARLRMDLESRDKIINALLQRIGELEIQQITDRQALQQQQLLQRIEEMEKKQTSDRQALQQQQLLQRIEEMEKKQQTHNQTLQSNVLAQRLEEMQKRQNSDNAISQPSSSVSRNADLERRQSEQSQSILEPSALIQRFEEAQSKKQNEENPVLPNAADEELKKKQTTDENIPQQNNPPPPSEPVDVDQRQNSERQRDIDPPTSTSEDLSLGSAPPTSRRFSISSEISDLLEIDSIIEHPSDEKVDRRTITVSPRFRRTLTNGSLPPNSESQQQQQQQSTLQDNDTAKKRRSRMLGADSIGIPDVNATVPIPADFQCQSCKNVISGEWLEANGKKFHRNCFKCSSCGEAIKDRYALKATDSSPICRNCLTLSVKSKDEPKEAPKKKEPAAAATSPSSTNVAPLSSNAPPQTSRGNEKICAACQEPIPKGERINALGKNWHVRCFVCQRCGCQFPDWKFFAHADQPVCASCKKFLL